MTDEESDTDFDSYFSSPSDDYRQSEEWEVTKVATKLRSDASIIVQHPFRETVDGDDVVETMGLSVSSPTPSGVVTVQNTSTNSSLSERFVALDVEAIPDLIDALEEAEERYYDEETFICPVCDTTHEEPDELAEDEKSYKCSECGYRL